MHKYYISHISSKSRKLPTSKNSIPCKMKAIVVFRASCSRFEAKGKTHFQIQNHGKGHRNKMNYEPKRLQGPQISWSSRCTHGKLSTRRAAQSHAKLEEDETEKKNRKKKVLIFEKWSQVYNHMGPSHVHVVGHFVLAHTRPTLPWFNPFTLHALQ